MTRKEISGQTEIVIPLFHGPNYLLSKCKRLPVIPELQAAEMKFAKSDLRD